MPIIYVARESAGALPEVEKVVGDDGYYEVQLADYTWMECDSIDDMQMFAHVTRIIEEVANGLL